MVSLDDHLANTQWYPVEVTHKFDIRRGLEVVATYRNTAGTMECTTCNTGGVLSLDSWFADSGTTVNSITYNSKTSWKEIRTYVKDLKFHNTFDTPLYLDTGASTNIFDTVTFENKEFNVPITWNTTLIATGVDTRLEALPRMPAIGPPPAASEVSP